MDKAKIFQNGGSQAVRLPKAYRFDTDSVMIKETPMGLLLIADTENFWKNWLEQLREFEWDITIEDLDRDTDPDSNQDRPWDDVFT